MIKKIRLILTFYKSFAFASNLITLVCGVLIHGFGAKGIYIIQPIFWFKIFTLAIIVFFIQSYKKNEFYYYKNLGISKLNLWIPTLIFDFVTFLVLIITVASQNYETHP
jgi:hypothetical protein